MVFLSRLATACFIVALPVFLITANVRFLAGEERLYERGFRKYDADKVTGLPLTELDRAAAEIIDYFEDEAATLRIRVTRAGEEEALFNQREVEHMVDVKRVMRFVFRLNEASLAFVLTYVAGVFLWARSGSMRRLAKEVLAAIALMAALAAAVGALALIGFEALWERFHEIVFTNDLWQLNARTDRLIQMFPEEFWQEMTLFLVAMTAVEVVVLVAAAVAYLVFGRAKPSGPEPIKVRPVKPEPIATSSSTGV
ncbi:MAG: TIGR01906 family membrane protein [Dehalococcoidia bacterium]